MMISKAKIAAAALVTAMTAGVGPTSPASAQACSADCLTRGDSDVAIVAGGIPRRFKVHVPASYDPRSAAPLVLDLHGFTSTSEEERSGSGQLEQSDRRGFIAVWPQGIAMSWNGYGCCAVAYDTKVDDVGFLRQIIATLKRRANIDPKRVYITGISNGGSLSQRMACEAADVITAAAPVSFPLATDRCQPSRPVTVIEIAGTADTTIPYDGKEPAAPIPPDFLGGVYGVQGARQSLAAWKIIAQCTDTLTRVQLPAGSRSESYDDCRGGVRVGLVSLAGAGHIPYNGATARSGAGNASIDVASYIWDNIFNK